MFRVPTRISLGKMFCLLSAGLNLKCLYWSNNKNKNSEILIKSFFFSQLYALNNAPFKKTKKLKNT